MENELPRSTKKNIRSARLRFTKDIGIDSKSINLLISSSELVAEEVEDPVIEPVNSS